MATPNLIAIATINPKSEFQTVSDSAAAICTAGANSCFKINALIVTNTTASAATVTVDVYRSSTAYVIIDGLSVPADSVVVLIGKDAPIYLEATDALRLTSGTASALKAVVSYEDLQ